jgi:hypothetical protein
MRLFVLKIVLADGYGNLARSNPLTTLYLGKFKLSILVLIISYGRRVRLV